MNQNLMPTLSHRMLPTPSRPPPRPPPPLLDTPCHPRTPPSSHRTMQALSMRAAVAKPLVSALPRAGAAPAAGRGLPGTRNTACKGCQGPAGPRPALPVPQPCTSLEPQAGAAQRPQRAVSWLNSGSRAALGALGRTGSRAAAAAHASAARPTRPLLPRRWARPPPRLVPPAAPWRCVPLPAPTGCPAPTSPPTWRTASCPAAVSDLQAGLAAAL